MAIVSQPGGAPPAPSDAEDSPPPILGSWRNVYIVVLAYLVLIIFLFHLFRKAFES